MTYRLSLLALAAGAASLAFTAAAGAAPLDKPAAGAAAKEAPPPARPAVVSQSQAEAQRLSDAFVSVADRVSPSVVQIDVTAREDNQDQLLRWLGGGGGDSPVAHGTGSGVVFAADGSILTNNHVIEDALTITVRLRDGRVLPARLLGRDPETDLAVVKVDATGLAPAKFADSDAARVGEWVVAIGSPFGFSYTVTAGILGAKGRFGLGANGANGVEDFLQTDASINPGNSGGPLCDLDGKVLGINTLIVGGRNSGEHIGFAVASNMARHVAEQIQKTGHVERAWIGIGVQDLTPELAAALKLDPRSGALVNAVAEGGPGAKANLKPGDVIAAMGGVAVHEAREVSRAVLNHDPGQGLALEIIRDGKHYGSSVTLGTRKEDAPPPVPIQQQGAPQVGLGLGVRDITVQQAAQVGIDAHGPVAIISSVNDGSAADRAGLKKGDIVAEVDGKVDPSAAEVQQAAADGQILVRVRRRHQEFYAALRK
ncbi:MAG TPA: trypsin-like peptidase domain-containing protein [Polyangiaceae bacterium]|jgi:Do/DeqQ family serine protease